MRSTGVNFSQPEVYFSEQGFNFPHNKNQLAAGSFTSRSEPNRFAAILKEAFVNQHYDTRSKKDPCQIVRYWELVDNNLTYSVENWKSLINTWEEIITAHHYNLAAAVKAVRDHRHPGRVVEERDEASFFKLLNEGIIPPNLQDLLKNRFAHGTPSAFGDQPPPRSGPDKMHRSAAEHIDEVLELIWKEASSGKTILISAGFREKHLPDVPNSPIARIPKFDAKGVERKKGRVIRNHSYPHGKSVNSAATQPPDWPIVLPTIWMILHDVEHLKRIAPNVPILICKRDVSAAFEWCAWHEDLVQYMGSFVEDVNKDGFGDTFVFPMRATFGYLLSPSEWSIHGNAIDILNAAARPKVIRRDGPWPIFARGYVDDFMILIPDIGLRKWITPIIVEDNMRALLGHTAINEKKNAEEGHLDIRGILLGFEINTELELITVSSEKLEKARNFVNDPMFDWGNTKITKRDVQKLIGRLIYLGVVCRSIQVFVCSCITMVTKEGPFHRATTPIFLNASVEKGKTTKIKVWENFWKDVRWIRHILEKDLLTSAPISAPFVTVLHPALRYEQARSNDNFVMIGTDATMWSCAAIRYDNNEGLRFQLPEIMWKAILSAVTVIDPNLGKEKGKQITMGITELLAVLGALLTWKEDLEHSLIVIIIDSSNALSWIRTRKAKNWYAQALLRILGRLEIRYKTTVWAEEIRSEENDLPDCLSRLRDRYGTLQTKEVDRWRKLSTAKGKKMVYKEVEPPFPRHWFEGSLESDWDLLLPDEELPKDLSNNTSDETAKLANRKEPTYSHTNNASTIPIIKLKWPQSDVLTSSLGNYGGLQDCTEQDIAAAVQYLEANILAERTKSKYEADFKAWSEFQAARGKPRYLYNSAPGVVDTDLRAYVAYLGVIKGLRHTTVGGHLSAIRYYHLNLGYGDPTSSTRVRALVKGLKRVQGVMLPKRPVTPEMLLHIKNNLDTSSPLHLYIWAALVTGFSGMLRASEYLGESNETYDIHKVLLVKNVKFVLLGKYTSDYIKADEVELFIRGSKTDQYGEGVFRSFKANNSELCLVKALKDLWVNCKPRQGTTPLFWITNHGMLTRNFISETLKLAATELGESQSGISSHSLRGGGATALYTAGYTIEQVMYLGRWLSSSWMRYVKMVRKQIDRIDIDLGKVEVDLVDYPARRRQSIRTVVAPKPTKSKSTNTPLQPGDAWWVEEDKCVYAIIRMGKRRNVDNPVYYYAPTEYWEQVKLTNPTATPKELGRLIERKYVVQYSLVTEVLQEWNEHKRENIFGGMSTSS